MHQSERIMREVAMQYGITFTELRNDSKKKKYSWPRQVACLRLYDETRLSFPQIARLIGLKDHTSIIYAVKACRQKIKQGLLEGELDESVEL
jgi:chromosomal replication initiator protein